MKRIIILGAVVLLVVLAWSGAWFWAAAQITATQKQLAAADGTTTPKVTCASFSVGGYPFGFDLTCTGATVTSGDMTVTATGLKASALVYNPTHVLLFAQSPVAVVDAFTGSQSRLDFTSAEASARLDGWRIGRVSVVVEAPVWNDTVLEDRLIAKAAHVEAHLIDVPEKHDAKAGLASLAEFAEVDGLDAPGPAIAGGKAKFEGEVANLPDDVRTYGDADLLKRWQAAAGMFTLKTFTGDDATRNFTAAGNLSLDSGGRVQGQLKLQSKGLVEGLGPSIPEQYRGLITGAPAADGSYSQTINIAAGVVFTGLVPVTMLAPLF